jgi:hypothetical protein
MKRRRRFKQTQSFHDRLAAWADEIREQAASLPSGPERDALLKKASQADVASHLNDLVSSPGLQSPNLDP